MPGTLLRKEIATRNPTMGTIQGLETELWNKWDQLPQELKNSFISHEIKVRGVKDMNSVMFLWMDGLFNELLCKVVSTSTTSVFIMNALPDRFLSVIDPVSRNRYIKSIIIDTFGAVLPTRYFC
ncbi:hypothetical protein TNCV_4451041 [Trichonephila clavipes]|nr:hypothetical protein TNCV_4451041 [Trichonephila clavipes]